jgi:hypothetical protein
MAAAHALTPSAGTGTGRSLGPHPDPPAAGLHGAWSFFPLGWMDAARWPQLTPSPPPLELELEGAWAPTLTLRLLGCMALAGWSCFPLGWMHGCHVLAGAHPLTPSAGLEGAWPPTPPHAQAAGLHGPGSGFVPV